MAIYMPSEKYPLGCEMTLTLIFTPESFGNLIFDPFSESGIVGEPCYAEVDDILHDKVYCGYVFPNIMLATGAHIVGKSEHKFTPYGRTLANLLSASHLVMHTYPERRAIVVSANVCTDKAVEGLRQLTPKYWKKLAENSGHTLEFCDVNFRVIPTRPTTSKLWAVLKERVEMAWKVVSRYE